MAIEIRKPGGLIGSLAAHDLDAKNTAWDDQRILSEATAEVEVQRLSPFRPKHVHRQFQRKLRQMRGRIENAALEVIIYRDGFTGLPAFADDMIADHLAIAGAPKVALADRVFMHMAIRKSATAKRPSPEDLAPVRVRLD